MERLDSSGVDHAADAVRYGCLRQRNTMQSIKTIGQLGLYYYLISIKMAIKNQLKLVSLIHLTMTLKYYLVVTGGASLVLLGCNLLPLVVPLDICFCISFMLTLPLVCFIFP